MQMQAELRHAAFELGSIPWQERRGPRSAKDGRIRILGVDDDVLLADQITEAVRRMGLEPVGPVGTLGAAVALAETQELHGALLDVRLQRELRVYPVAEVLQRRRIPFCFMTAYCEQRVAAMTAEAVLYKPFSLSALRAAINALLDA